MKVQQANRGITARGQILSSDPALEDAVSQQVLLFPSSDNEWQSFSAPVVMSLSEGVVLISACAVLACSALAALRTHVPSASGGAVGGQW